MGLLSRMQEGFSRSRHPVTFRVPIQLAFEVIKPVLDVDILFPPSQDSVVRIGEFARTETTQEFHEELHELRALENGRTFSGNFAQVEHATPSINLVSLPPYGISDDLALQEIPAEEPVGRPEISSVDVSANLFKPLGRPSRVAGKRYAGSVVDPAQQPLFPSERDLSGYRRSFREGPRTRTKISRTTLSIWDLLLPILQPPLRLDFPAILDLPSPLYRYQVDGVKFLLDQDCALLGDDMGTGKTVQSIVAMRMLFQAGKINSALVVCPLSVLRNWDRELEKWAPTLSPTVVRGSREVRETCWGTPAHLWLTTYDTLRIDIDFLEKLKRYRPAEVGGLNFDLAIIDEAQKIKNPSSGISQAVKRIKGSRRWGLSGTPVENRLEDLASIYAFLKPGLLRLQGLDAATARTRISPYFLRRRKADVLPDLPEKINHEVWLPLENEQRHAYDLAERKGIVHLKSLGKQVTVHHVLALLTKLKQLCNVDPQTGESAKLHWLIDNLEQVFEGGDKALIYSQFREEYGVGWLEQQLLKFRPLCYVGGLSDRQRDRVLETFEHRDDHPLLLLTRAGGLGLNLTAANYVIHVDHWWNPATTAQATDRTHRIGQKKKVFVYHLWAENTVEERIYRILEQKRRLYDEVIDVLSNVQGTGLTQDDLFALFELRGPDRVPVGRDLRIEKPQDLLSRSPEEFESLVAELYKKWGYGVRVTRRTRDGGIDLIATNNVPGGLEKIAVQCKRFAHPVGVEHARELLGVVSSDPSITKGVLVSPSTFTDDCRNFCDNNGRLDLIDGPTLVRFINS